MQLCFACPCQYGGDRPLLYLRGLCQSSELSHFGTPYTIKQKPGLVSDVFFVGLVTTQIRYNDSSEQWVMTDAMSNTTAVTKASKISYILGKHNWTVNNDVTSCNGGSYTTLLKMSNCLIGFTCNSGECVTMEQRCDQLADCRDKSDEEGCKLLELETSYNRKVPPITPIGGGNFTPTFLNVSIDLMKIVNMEETLDKINIQFQITLEWRENRAKFNNLNKKTSLNALTDEDIGNLWLPLVVYDNTDQKDTTRLGMAYEWNTPISVMREGSYPDCDSNPSCTRAMVYEVDERDLYEGKANKLIMQQVYTLILQCKYHLQQYPFDTQVNRVSIIMHICMFSGLHDQHVHVRQGQGDCEAASPPCWDERESGPDSVQDHQLDSGVQE